jgi:uncharacterized protein (TIGR02001 family)
MIKKTLIAGAVVAALGLPGVVMAAGSDFTVSSNVGLFSQYVFRGIAQSDEKPALQGGFDLTHSSGLYAGFWGSSISWINDFGYSNGGNGLETDWYGGYRNSFGDTGIGYDVGLLYYYYPGEMKPGNESPDTLELYGALSYKWASLKVSYNLRDYFGFTGNTGTNGSDGTLYYDLSANIPVADSGFTVNLHYGILDVRNDLNSPNKVGYNDWKVGASYALPKNFTVGAYFTGTDADRGFYTILNGKDTSRDEFVAFVSTSF